MAQLDENKEGMCVDSCLEPGEIRSRCRCGFCCVYLIVKATASDVRREPSIAERGRFIGDSPATGNGPTWVLNSPEGPCVFFDRDNEGLGVCEIYQTRPQTCRGFDCDQPIPGGLWEPSKRAFSLFIRPLT
jgi:hypothetical protein